VFSVWIWSAFVGLIHMENGATMEQNPSYSFKRHVFPSLVSVTSVTAKCCSDGRRCYRQSCDIILTDGSVVSCKRRRGSRGRFTRAKSGVGF
jgi:hypothetical protein